MSLLAKLRYRPLGFISLWIFSVLFLVSLTAEFWANNEPLFLSFRGRWYFPIFFEYHPTEFGLSEVQMDYRKLNLAAQDFALWPLIRWSPLESNSKVEQYPSPPSQENRLGTDDRGRDLLTRLIYGLRYTLLYAIGGWVLTFLLGIVLGAAMGYFGGKVDLLLSRVLEVFESIPRLIVLVTLVSFFEPNLVLLMVFTVLMDWTSIATYLRGEVLSLRKREFILAAQALGESRLAIIRKHILPNSMTSVISFSPFVIAANVTTLSVLDYLGLGLRPPTPSWGELLLQAQQHFRVAEWLVWFPILAVVGTLFLLMNIGLAFRDILDARESSMGPASHGSDSCAGF